MVFHHIDGKSYKGLGARVSGAGGGGGGGGGEWRLISTSRLATDPHFEGNLQTRSQAIYINTRTWLMFLQQFSFFFFFFLKLRDMQYGSC